MVPPTQGSLPFQYSLPPKGPGRRGHGASGERARWRSSPSLLPLFSAPAERLEGK